MARRTSWLPRLYEIHNSVRNSIRSHYERRDIEYLFQLQPRAAQQLMGMIDVGVRVGQSHLVDRTALEQFLDVLKQSDNPENLLESRRHCRPNPISRKKLRDLVQVDQPPIRLHCLPKALSLESGKVTINFQNMEELANALYGLAQILEHQYEEFSNQYEPAQIEIQSQTPENKEVQVLFEELEQLKATKQFHGA